MIQLIYVPNSDLTRVRWVFVDRVGTCNFEECRQPPPDQPVS